MQPTIRLLLIVLFVLAGCETHPTSVNSGTATEVTAILQEIKGNVAQLQTAQKGVADAQAALALGNKGALQFISDRINSADFFNSKNPDQQSQYVVLVGKELAPTKVLLPAPSEESQIERERNLQLALSQLKEDKAKLEADYAKLQLEAERIKGSNDILQKTVTEKSAALDTTSNDLKDKVTKLADTEGKVRIQAAENEERNKELSRTRAAETRMKVAYGAMALGGLIILAAVIATFFHVPNVLFPGLGAGGTCLFIGWTLTYVEDLLQQLWFRVAAGTLIACIMTFIVYMVIKALGRRREMIEDKVIATGSIGALQDAKNDDAKLGTNKFGAIADHLDEWFVDKNGKPDITIHDAIDKRLVAMNLKNPMESGGSSQPSPTPTPTPVVS